MGFVDGFVWTLIFVVFSGALVIGALLDPWIRKHFDDY
jgi:hypothetical protein